MSAGVPMRPSGMRAQRALAPLRMLGGDLGELGVDQAGRQADDADAVARPGLAERLGQADGAGLGGRIGRVAAVGRVAGDRADDDDHAFSRGQRVVEFHGAGHQAVEVDRHHPVPALGLELAAAIDDRALAKDQHVQRRRPGGRRRSGRGRRRRPGRRPGRSGRSLRRRHSRPLRPGCPRRGPPRRVRGRRGRCRCRCRWSRRRPGPPCR